ncbi:MAG: PDZ domain-containing protein [Paludibacteraceae bacterium]|nr:PDZ domain-containing protein [Paludibacteraceae bacterium]
MKKYIFPTLTIICLMLGFWIGNAVSNQVNAQRSNLQHCRLFKDTQPETKIDQILSLVNTGYVDPINMDSITEIVAKEIIQSLDPHSAYIPKEDLEMVNSELSASFSGVGIQFSIQNDTVQVVAVISGGPCEGVGVLAGDKIVMVNDSVFTGKSINNERVMHSLRGPKGTKVKLGIQRSGASERLDFTITRGDIPVHSVDAKFIITAADGSKIGFVRVSRFAENTYNEFISAMSSLKAKGATSYIVDLRENSGGYMDQAIRMANEFLAKGDLIVYSEGRAYPRYDAKATGTGRFQREKLVVLIDNFSASASEIFAGAMQDNDRATIVGRRSFGKGLVQQQLMLNDGSAIRLTVARYYTPSGRSIQKPYTMGEQEDYEMDLLERFEHGEFFSADSIHFADTTAYYTKKGRKVMGGGGIMPDVFVGRDTTLYTPYFNRVSNLAYTYQFAYQYTDRHRQELLKYTTWQDLEKHLIEANWVDEFVAYAQSKGVEPNPEQLAISRPLLVRIVNAYIVRNILNDEGFFPLYERDDDITKKAVEELTK